MKLLTKNILITALCLTSTQLPAMCLQKINELYVQLNLQKEQIAAQKQRIAHLEAQQAAFPLPSYTIAMQNPPPFSSHIRSESSHEPEMKRAAPEPAIAQPTVPSIPTKSSTPTIQILEKIVACLPDQQAAVGRLCQGWSRHKLSATQAQEVRNYLLSKDARSWFPRREYAEIEEILNRISSSWSLSENKKIFHALQSLQKGLEQQEYERNKDLAKLRREAEKTVLSRAQPSCLPATRLTSPRKGKDISALLKLVEDRAAYTKKNPGGCAHKEKPIHMPEADLEGIVLPKGANLWNAELPGANLKGAKMRDVELGYANLAGADLTGADFSQEEPSATHSSRYGNRAARCAKFTNANLTDCNCTKVNFYDATFEGTTVAGAQFSRANFRSVRGLTPTRKKYILSTGADELS